MTPRNTSTGAVLEAMVLPALDRGGYVWRVQIETGTRPGGRRHQVDAIAEKDGRSVLVSLKWQQTSGVIFFVRLGMKPRKEKMWFPSNPTE